MRVRVSVEAAEAFELVLSLAAPGAVGVDVDPALLRAVDELGHGSDMFWAHLLSIAVEAPPPRDVSAFLAHLSAVGGRELRLRLCGYYVRWFRRLTPPEVIERALAGDVRSQAALLATSAPEDAAWQAALRTVLDTSAATLKRRLLDVVGRWADAIAPVLERRQGVLRGEAVRRRAAIAGLSAHEAVQAVAGYDYIPEPGIERVLLIPSAMLRGERHVFDHAQLKLICYPVAVAESVPWEPPVGLASAFQALGDPTRLRMLHMLAREPLSAGRVAERLGLPITTAVHHLAVLRRAELLRGGGGRGQVYSVAPGVEQRMMDGLGSVVAQGDILRGNVAHGKGKG